MFGRLYKPHSPSPPGAPRTLSMKLSSQVQKRCNRIWRQRHAELSDDGILTLYKSGNEYRLYDLNSPKKMVVGAGKSSLHIKLITHDRLGLHLKVKGDEMELWAKRMMDLKFPNEEATNEAEDDSSFSLDDSVVDCEPLAEELPNYTLTTVYESDNASMWSGKRVEIGPGLPICKSRVSMESMDATQHTSEEHLEEGKKGGGVMEIRKCREKEEVRELGETKEAEQVKEEKPLNQPIAQTPFPSKDARSPKLFQLSEEAMKKVEAIVNPKEVKEENENSDASKAGYVARMATLINRRVRGEFRPEEQE